MNAENPLDPLRRLAGNIIIAIGVLWALLCGSCTAYFLFLEFRGGQVDANQILSALALTLIPGGIGIAIGLGIYAVGRAIAGRRKT